MVLSDWWNASAGRLLTSEQAVKVFRGVTEASLLPLWDGTELLGLVGPLLRSPGWPEPACSAGGRSRCWSAE